MHICILCIIGDMMFLTKKNDALSDYLKNLAQIPLLSVEEEKSYVKKMHEGDATARTKLIEANLRLVIYFAKHYKNRGLLLEDVIAEGNAGLITAIDHFKSERGCRLATYASYWIKQTIAKAITHYTNTIQLPSYVTDQLRLLTKITKELNKSLKRKPTDEELCDATCFSLNVLNRVRSIRSDTLSLDVSFFDDDGSVCELNGEAIYEDTNMLSSIDYVSNSQNTKILNNAISQLKDTESKVIRDMFGFNNMHENKSLAAVGKDIHKSRERVRQIECEAIKKLKKKLKTMKITSFTDVY